MPKLNQIVAIATGQKTRSQDALTKLYHILQKPALFAGQHRTYEPLNEEGQRFQPESVQIQVRAPQVLADIEMALTPLYDVTAQQDFSNCVARADVKVDGKAIIADAPIPYLLFLEKRLVDLRTALKAIPTLDPSVSWRWSEDQNLFVSDPQTTYRTEKEPTVVTLAAPTDKHPAQTQLLMLDKNVGTWTTFRYSGAAKASDVDAMVARVDRLIEAVKFAREKANSIDAVDVKVAGPIFDYVLRGVVS